MHKTPIGVTIFANGRFFEIKHVQKVYKGSPFLRSTLNLKPKNTIGVVNFVKGRLVLSELT